MCDFCLHPLRTNGILRQSASRAIVCKKNWVDSLMQQRYNIRDLKCLFMCLEFKMAPLYSLVFAPAVLLETSPDRKLGLPVAWSSASESAKLSSELSSPETSPKSSALLTESGIGACAVVVVTSGLAVCAAAFTAVRSRSWRGIYLEFNGKKSVHSCGKDAVHSGQLTLLYTSRGHSKLIAPRLAAGISNARRE